MSHEVLQRNRDGVGALRRADGPAAATVELPVGGPYDVDATVSDVFVGDVWVLAGQSNMGGEATDAPLLPPLERSRMFCFDRTWKETEAPLHRLFESADAAQFKLYTLVDPTRTPDEMDELFRAYHAAGGHRPCPGASAGYFFAQAYAETVGVPVGLIPCALGASPLAMWTRGFTATNGRGEVVTGLFEDMIERVRAAVPDGRPPAGVVWYQGESDAYDERSPDYGERFARFVADVRAALDAPDLPFITVQLGRSTVWPPELERAWVEVRDHQRRAAAAIPGVEVVAAADLPVLDGIHLTTAAFETLGPRLAKAASAYVPGDHPRWTAPNLASAALAEDRCSVRLSFSGVNGGLRLNGEPTDAFHVGDHPVAAVEVDEAEVVLRLRGPVDPGATVSYGAAYAPSLCLVDQADMPVPLFGPVPLG